jgi:hypothetical protein
MCIKSIARQRLTLNAHPTIGALGAGHTPSTYTQAVPLELVARQRLGGALNKSRLRSTNKHENLKDKTMTIER